MSNYIMDLRKIVGHRTLLQVGASVIVEDSEGTIIRNRKGKSKGKQNRLERKNRNHKGNHHLGGQRVRIRT